MDIITIANFTNSPNAYIAKSLLENNGIECYIKDENIINIRPIYSPVLGGVKLQVAESDVENAINILTEHGYIKPEEPDKNPTSTIQKFIAFLCLAIALLSLLYFMHNSQ